MSEIAETGPPPEAPALTEPPASHPPPPATEDPSVEIHKIKPIHSWRDFFKELGTIVLGIIIAITLEHLVEEWSWDREVKTARQSLIAEISANNENFMAFRMATSSCVERQLREADTILTALESGQKADGMTRFQPAPFTLIRDSEWQSERASQVLTHFPREELAMMGRYYGQLPDFHNWGSQEERAWQELSLLQGPQKGTATSDINRLRVALRAAQDAEYLVVLNARRQLALSKRLGIPDSPPDPVRVKNYCTLSKDDYRRYRSSQDLR